MFDGVAGRPASMRAGKLDCWEGLSTLILLSPMQATFGTGSLARENDAVLCEGPCNYGEERNGMDNGLVFASGSSLVVVTGFLTRWRPFQPAAAFAPRPWPAGLSMCYSPDCLSDPCSPYSLLYLSQTESLES
jgi:hypothetical protein